MQQALGRASLDLSIRCRWDQKHPFEEKPLFQASSRRRRREGQEAGGFAVTPGRSRGSLALVLTLGGQGCANGPVVGGPLGGCCGRRVMGEPQQLLRASSVLAELGPAPQHWHWGSPWPGGGQLPGRGRTTDVPGGGGACAERLGAQCPEDWGSSRTCPSPLGRAYLGHPEPPRGEWPAGCALGDPREQRPRGLGLGSLRQREGRACVGPRAVVQARGHCPRSEGSP